MSDDETLTLRASGPAEATLSDETDGVEITTTTEVELEATIDVDAEWLDEHGGISKNGAFLKPREIAELVTKTRSGADGTFTPIEAREEWTLEFSGSFEAWLEVTIPLAKRYVSVGGSDRVANAVCSILDDLAEFATDDRPRLAMVDVCGSYDPSDYSRQKVLSELSERAEEMPDADASAEAIADD